MSDKIDEIVDVIGDSFIDRFITYVFNSDYRKAIEIKKWLSDAFLASYDEINTTANLIGQGSTHDETMIRILKWVENNITYVGDMNNWSMSEHWNTPKETLDLKEGDCEDGAVLMMALALKLGIPEGRLLLWTGDALGGGHCSLLYKPGDYPLDWTMMDWCYFPTFSSIGFRSMFRIKGNTIMEYKINNDGISGTQVKTSKYESIWFLFNRKHSYLRMDYSFKNRSI
jgi:hypothetical protein